MFGFAYLQWCGALNGEILSMFAELLQLMTAREVFVDARLEPIQPYKLLKNAFAKIPLETRKL